MNKEIIYSMNTAYRGEYEIQGFSYGSGDKAACIVGAMRGNEFQQLYISSLLAKKLGELEARGAIVSGKKILLIPSINYSSFNVGKKYWITDNSDINRSFPGNPEGQATSRIAAAVMEKVTGYAYGIQFASFYMDGEFIPHVRMIETGKQSNSLASQFGMPYVLTAEPRSYDKATLNYNWQMRGTEAFSVYSGVTDTINGESANQAVSSVLRFLTRMGVIRYNCHAGYISTIMDEEDLLSIRCRACRRLLQEACPAGRRGCTRRHNCKYHQSDDGREYDGHIRTDGRNHILLSEFTYDIPEFGDI